MPAKNRLSRQVQCRFTDEQYALLERLADRTGLPLSAVIRGVVVVWSREQIAAPDHVATAAEVQLLVDELNALAAAS